MLFFEARDGNKVIPSSDEGMNQNRMDYILLRYAITSLCFPSLRAGAAPLSSW